MLLSFFWTLRIISMVSYSNWNSYKKILIISLHFYTNVLLLIIVFMVKMHFYKHVFNVFQKNQVLLLVSHISIHWWFSHVFYASVGILFCAILCIHFSIRLFFLFTFVNSISLSFLFSSLILSITFILMPTSQTITPLH